MASSRDICRLCLEVSNDFDLLDEGKRRMLEQIIINQNLTSIDHPLVCFKCRDSLEQFYDFKMTCLNNEMLFVNCSGNTELNLAETVQRNADQIVVKTEEENICPFCLKCLENVGFVKFVMDTDTYFKDMLLKCLPEMGPSITNQQLICNDCIKNLQNMYSFVINCVDNERKINETMQIIGATSNGHIDLKDALKFICDVKNDDENVKTGLDFIKCETFEDNSQNLEAFEEANDIPNFSENTSNLQKEEFKPLEEDTLHIKSEDSFICEADVAFESNSLQEQIKNSSDMMRHVNTEYSVESKLKNLLSEQTVTQKNKSKSIMYKCTQCSYENMRKSHLRRHMLVHKDKSEVSMHKCTECSFTTKHKVCLQRHTLMHKDNSEVAMHKCPECSYESKYKDNLRSHMLVHKDISEVTMYRCTQCSFVGKRSSCLQKHMLTHKNPSERAARKCRECGFESKREGAFRYHLLVHKGKSKVTMRKCTECDFKSLYKTSFEKHMLTHRHDSEVQMYNCASCSYQCKYKDNLRRHMLVHKDRSNVEMHKCTECSYETKDKSCLRRHMLIHKDRSEVTMHKCTKCRFETKYRSSLHTHMTSMHKETSEGAERS